MRPSFFIRRSPNGEMIMKSRIMVNCNDARITIMKTWYFVKGASTGAGLGRAGGIAGLSELISFKGTPPCDPRRTRRCAKKKKISAKRPELLTARIN
jgi:hypothetical protein